MGDRILLMRLYEKTSAKGNRYFAGRLGAASVVMMLDERAENADPVWQVFVSEPRAPSEVQQSAPQRRQVETRSAPPTTYPDLNDDISDLSGRPVPATV